MKKSKIITGGLILALSILNLSCSVFGIRSEENPKHVVVLSEKEKKIEIRSYSPSLVAKTYVKGEFKEVQGEAFRILAGYIFGKNEKKQKISMTAPVVQNQEQDSEKIAMTAPVVQSPTEQGWAMTFIMPSEYTLEDLPRPTDTRIILEEVPARTFAVIRYTGLGRESTNRKKTEELKAWLKDKKDYEIVSGPSFAGYDPPWTIPFLRRNEMMIEIKVRN